MQRFAADPNAFCDGRTAAVQNAPESVLTNHYPRP